MQRPSLPQLIKYSNNFRTHQRTLLLSHEKLLGKKKEKSKESFPHMSNTSTTLMVMRLDASLVANRSTCWGSNTYMFSLFVIITCDDMKIATVETAGFWTPNAGSNTELISAAHYSKRTCWTSSSHPKDAVQAVPNSSVLIRVRRTDPTQPT